MFFVRSDTGCGPPASPALDLLKPRTACKASRDGPPCRSWRGTLMRSCAPAFSAASLGSFSCTATIEGSRTEEGKEATRSGNVSGAPTIFLDICGGS
eukprot:3915677-Pyramimonas_sp.AAC.1